MFHEQNVSDESGQEWRVHPRAVEVMDLHAPIVHHGPISPTVVAVGILLRLPNFGSKEMSHSGLVRPPAKRVEVYTSRGFKSRHLRSDLRKRNGRSVGAERQSQFESQLY